MSSFSFIVKLIALTDAKIVKFPNMPNFGAKV